MEQARIRTEKISDQLRDIIRESIFSRQYRPGEKLPSEQELADTFGVSKSSVREALGQLAAEGLIVKRRGALGGSFVAQGDADRVRTALADNFLLGGISFEEVAGLRLILEPAVVQLACRLRTAEDLAALEDLLASCQEDLEAGRPDPLKLSDFLRLTAAACHNRLITHLMEAVSDAYEATTHALPLQLEDGRRWHDFNRQLFNCLEKREDRRAKVLVLENFRRSQELAARAGVEDASLRTS